MRRTPRRLTACSSNQTHSDRPFAQLLGVIRNHVELRTMMETMMADDELCDFNLTAQHGTHSVRVHRAVVAAAAPKQAAGRTCECEQASLGREGYDVHRTAVHRRGSPVKTWVTTSRDG